jgi:polyhydroxyalkanoate synthesis regulator phasin
MKKKILLIVSGVILAAVLAFAVVPVAAASNDGTLVPHAIQQTAKGRVILQLLRIQDESKVDAILAQAVSNGKITADQSAKIKDFWTAHHTQFLKNRIVNRLLRVQDQAKLQTFLDQAVANGKLSQDQANKVMALWQTLHTS